MNKLAEIKGEITEHDILVTMDVHSLYTNIPNDEGIQAVREKLNNSPSRIPTRVITTLLLLILTLNNFIFNGVNYLQTLGCAMVTICAPSANIFMGRFEETQIYPRIVNKIRTFLRYIDDLFFIWKGTEAELKTFLNEINQVHPAIKFDYHTSKHEVNFLDLTIYKDAYSKPTDRQAYLHKKSAHPSHLKKSIPYGQALRLKRICSDTAEFKKASIQLTTKLIGRGYNKDEVKEQIDRAAQKNREELLQYKEKTPMTRIPCVITYNHQLPNIKEAINKHWDILKINPQLNAISQKHKSEGYIRLKTILNGKVKRSTPIHERKGWCSPRNSRNFNLCQQMRNTNTFKSNMTKQEFKIYHRVTCKSKFIIYLLECILCGIQYIGKSEWPMNIRINKHRNDVFREEAIHVCQHFRQVSHNFNKHAKITMQKRTILEERENF